MGRLPKAQEVFLAAVDMPPHAREAFIAASCADDDALRREVEALLAHDAGQPPGFLAEPLATSFAALADGHPVVDAEEDAGAQRLIGATLGGCILQRLIAQGGMGDVYEARQTHPDRAVAVKVLRAWADSPSARRRFERESQILAEVSHPSVAHIYASGATTVEGRRVAFIVLELVQGAQTIVDFADAAALDRGGRLRLFARACEGVERAHQAGVIHRDLKPSNILIDNDGQPKIIDFGVAHAESGGDGTQMTQAGQLIGTLAYMAPEQVGGDLRAIDVRTDVYALGLILFRLLVGRLPYEMEDTPLPAAASMIATAAPAFPRERTQRLGRDLHAVIATALEKDRERRYQSVREFRQDIERVLRSEPVAARPPSMWIRASRWIGAHPVRSTTIACALIAILTIGSSLAVVRWLALAPARVVMEADGSAARLVSRGGATLAQWTSLLKHDERGVKYATYADRHASLGGGEVVALLGYVSELAQDYSGEACLIDPSAPYKPIWSTAEAPLPTPPGQAHRPEAKWDAMAGLVADFLPESPGEELFVLHRLRPYSACALRIFDLSGTLRYQVWHNGGLPPVGWFPDKRLLAVAAYESDAALGDRGVRTDALIYAPMVFALHPRDGHIVTDRWLVEPGEPDDPTLAWRKWLGPAPTLASAGPIAIDTDFPSAIIRGDDGMQVHFRLRKHGALFSTNVSSSGEWGSRWTSDDYKMLRDQGVVPHEAEWALLDDDELSPPGPGARSYDPPPAPQP